MRHEMSSRSQSMPRSKLSPVTALEPNIDQWWVFNCFRPNACNQQAPQSTSSQQRPTQTHRQTTSSSIESVQKCALKIIYGPGDYSDICVKQGLPTLASRWTEICTWFFNKSVLQKNSSLHYLLPRPRGEEAEKLRRPLPLVPQPARTTRFQQSYMIYVLNNYQL